MLRLSKIIIKNFSTYQIRSPFDIKLLRQEDTLAKIRKSMQSRYRDPNIANDLAQRFQNYKKNLYELQKMSKEVNRLQKQIKNIMKNNKNSELKNNQLQQKQDKQKKTILQKISQIKQTQKNMENSIKQQIKKIQQLVSKIGNIVDQSSPISKDQKDNQIIKQFKLENSNLQHSVSYSQICEKFGLTDLKRGQKVGGHRGYFLKAGAVRLALALAQYGIDFLQDKGYQIYQSPAIINQSTLKGSCQLQSIQQDVYKLQGLDSYLIATSEQSLAGYYKDEFIQRKQFPIRMAGYSTCFRKQAGAHGKDIHGLFRVHQFQKVEQFTIVQPQNSKDQMKKMMDISQQFYQSLKIPYRVVNIVSGQLNDAASCKYDLQAWFPSQKRYRQLVSVSNCTQYQSRLLKIQYQAVNNEVKYPHMLNGTLVAIQRTLTCLIQNNFYKTYITVPKVLQKYTGIERIQLNKKENEK